MAPSRIAIERDSGKPLYRQLREALEHEILSGALDLRQALPSSRELARELGLSRNTVNAAYMELEAEGYVEARPCRGLYVNQEMIAALEPSAPASTASTSGDFSDVIRPLSTSDLPEIAKVRDWQRYPYPFIAGQVDPSSFPRLPWIRSLRQALEPPHLHYSVRDGVDEDDPLLIEELCRRVLPGRGIEASPDQVLITNGAQQGLDLLAAATLAPGDEVGVEDPGYPDARHIFTHAGATLRPLPVDAGGLLPPPSLDGLRLLHLTPSHHCPTNVTLGIGRRRDLLARAAEADVLVIEDDYDSEFRYQGSPTPALKAIPGSDRVIYLGTFSKFLAPGLRLGYLVGPPEVVEGLRAYRRYRIRHTSGHEQRAMALFIGSGQYQRTVRRRRGQLSRRWEATRDALADELGHSADVPPGGVSIWVTGPPGLDCARLAADALAEGVVIERGDTYFTDSEQNRRHFRVGFAAIDVESIRPGIARLAALVRAQTG